MDQTNYEQVGFTACDYYSMGSKARTKEKHLNVPNIVSAVLILATVVVGILLFGLGSGYDASFAKGALLFTYLPFHYTLIVVLLLFLLLRYTRKQSFDVHVVLLLTAILLPLFLLLVP